MNKCLNYECHEYSESKDMILYALDEETHPPLHDHPNAVPLIKQFEHVSPKEISPCLFPKKDINHKTDLIPRSTLLNKLVYY